VCVCVCVCVCGEHYHSFISFNVAEGTVCYFKFNAIGNMQRNGMHLA